MIWLKSFGRALATGFEFGAIGGMLGGFTNGFWGIVTMLILGVPAGLLMLGMPAVLASGLDLTSVLSYIGNLAFFAGSIGAVIGGLISAIVMGFYGFFNGWRPQELDFYRVFRTVIWGGWLCFWAGGLTTLGAIGLWNLVTGNGLSLPPILSREPYIFLWLVFCFFLGSVTGAVAPQYVERFIATWSRIRHGFTAKPATPKEHEA